MSTIETWFIIILILGIIASNLLILKYSAKYKFTQLDKNHKKTQNTPSMNKTSLGGATRHKKHHTFSDK
ncbi:DUF2897 family protein [uncultured Shewanella sp.]|uniref:DUF2897 family protein n=1 Tax=uncultured Shewanella sp. TaxID=173975 RepID=UPI00260C2D17|nr:DUF2897 family protein [uncultured Shewanella sp.]